MDIIIGSSSSVVTKPFGRHLAIEQQGHAEADQHLPADRYQHVLRGDGEIGPDVWIGKQFAIVIQPDEMWPARQSRRGNP